MDIKLCKIPPENKTPQSVTTINSSPASNINEIEKYVQVLQWAQSQFSAPSYCPTPIWLSFWDSGLNCMIYESITRFIF